MLSSLLAIGWQPEIRGVIVVLIMFGVLIGGTYLIIGTNIGARLGFMVSLAGLAGWMFLMGIVWWTYGIGLKGREPSWKPANPITIIRDGALLNQANIVESPIDIAGKSPADAAATVASALESNGWTMYAESDPARGQAAASSDDIIQNKAKEYAAGDYLTVAVYDRGGERWPKINNTLDFIAFKHKPHYVLVEIAPVIPQRSEPGRAPARPVIDTTQPHRYVLMIRDLGSKRQPAMFITFGSGIIFFVMCWLMHRRDRLVRENRAALNPARA